MDRRELLQLLPHQGPALWLDAVLAHNAGQIDGCSDWRYLHALGPSASPCLLFEAAAQLCAVHGALHGNRAAGGSVLLGKVSRLRLHGPAQGRSGRLQLQASAALLRADGAQYRFRIDDACGALLDGELLLVRSDA